MISEDDETCDTKTQNLNLPVYFAPDVTFESRQTDKADTNLEEIYPCVFCLKRIKSRKCLLRHMRERHGERTFKCCFCGTNIKPRFESKCIPHRCVQRLIGN